MKTNYVSLAKRYELAYNQLWATLPSWKRQAIQEDLAAGKLSVMLDDMMKSVIRLAENEAQPISEEYPEAPILKQVQSVHD